MALKVDASYENGVLVPATPLVLAEHEQVRLTIEPTARTHSDCNTFSQRKDRKNLGSRTDQALALDFHPDGC